MQRDLRQLEQRWGLALQGASFGVWDLDVRAQTVHYSPQWKALLGYGDTDDVDSTSTWRARVHPDDLPPMLEALSQHLAGAGASYEMEFRLRAADGSYRWVLSRGRVVARDEQGQPLRAVGTLTDLTDRRRADALRAERDLAEATSHAKSEFLSRMSHELRTPLNAVLGFAQLLSRPGDGISSDERVRHAAQIERAGWHLLTLIEDVLDLSGLEAGRVDLASTAVPLVPVVEAALSAQASLAQRHGVRFVCGALPDHAVVQADRARLEQVLGKLLGNAVQYNRPGGSVVVEVAAAGGFWALSVRDTGIGIPAAQIAHLFEPFNRLGRDTSHVDGVGISLVLARSLVEAMGGQLTAQSTEGMGSTFDVRLPAAKA